MNMWQLVAELRLVPAGSHMLADHKTESSPDTGWTHPIFVCLANWLIIFSLNQSESDAEECLQNMEIGDIS